MATHRSNTPMKKAFQNMVLLATVTLFFPIALCQAAEDKRIEVGIPESDYKLIDTGIQVERNLFVHKSCLTVTCMNDTPGHRLVIEKDRFLDNRESLLPGISILEASSLISLALPRRMDRDGRGFCGTLESNFGHL